MDEALNFNNLGNINEIGQNAYSYSNPFFNGLKTAENRLKSIIEKSGKFVNLKDLKNIIDKNIYVSSFFKNKKFEKYVGNDFIQNYNNYKKGVNNIISNKYRENTININRERDLRNDNTINFNTINTSNHNNTINYNNVECIASNHKLNNQINNTINRANNDNNSVNIFEGEDLLSKKSSDGPKIYLNHNINCKNIILKYSNADENSSKGDIFNNSFIGNKRSSEELNRYSEEKQAIYNEIKDLYNKYKKNELKNNEQKQNKIYENKSTFFSKNETIILENNAVCIIYIKKDIIESIYLISDQKTIKEDRNIIEVLNKIKKDIKDLIENKKNNMFEE